MKINSRFIDLSNKNKAIANMVDLKVMNKSPTLSPKRQRHEMLIAAIKTDAENEYADLGGM